MTLYFVGQTGIVKITGDPAKAQAQIALMNKHGYILATREQYRAKQRKIRAADKQVKP